MPYPSSDQKEFGNGLAGVTAGQTSICSLDETLRYRGYAVSDLVHCSFEEVAFLLLWGELPTAHQLEAFTVRIQRAAHSQYLKQL